MQLWDQTPHPPVLVGVNHYHLLKRNLTEANKTPLLLSCDPAIVLLETHPMMFFNNTKISIHKGMHCGTVCPYKTRPTLGGAALTVLCPTVDTTQLRETGKTSPWQRQ